MNKKLLMIISLVLCMALCLCACASGNGDETSGSTEPSSNETTDPTNTSSAPEDSSEPENNNKTYTITLKDSQGNPLSGVMVQICLESCMPGITDENGVATFELPETSGYSAGVMDDYEATKVYYEDGQYDVTIVWDAPAAE